MTTRRIDGIKIGPRFRKDNGDIPAFAARIAKLGGLIQPVAIEADGMLRAGYRRYLAAKRSACWLKSNPRQPWPRRRHSHLGKEKQTYPAACIFPASQLQECIKAHSIIS